MDIKLHDGYIYTRGLDLDIEQQRSNAHDINEYLIQKFVDHPPTYPDGSFVTKYYAYYNYFTLGAAPGMTKLFHNIRETFIQCNAHAYNGNPPDNEYYIQCWLNYFRKGESFNWHTHLDEGARSWSGYYCVDVKPNSSTTYMIDDKEVEIESEDNLLVMANSNIVHRTSEWKEDKPRITLAFDINPIKNFTIPKYKKDKQENLHYWIPLV